MLFRSLHGAEQGDGPGLRREGDEQHGQEGGKAEDGTDDPVRTNDR